MDRRVLTAIVLMMVIAILPAILIRRPPPRPVADTTAVVRELPPAPPPPPTAVEPVEQAPTVPAQVVLVTTPLSTYGVSTRGARLVQATLHRYRSLSREESGQPAQILPEESDLLGLRLLIGRDTLSIRDWDFTPSAGRVEAGQPLVLTATGAGLSVTLRYQFDPDDYLFTLSGSIEGVGPNGGTLLIGLGPGLRNSEADSTEHQSNLAVVTKAVGETEQLRFSALDPGEVRELGGPFEWVAVKSKYFVASLFAIDTLDAGYVGNLSGVRVRPLDDRRRPISAEVLTSLALPPAGHFGVTLYLGPMEYPRLRGVGHAFYDVNPYGWPGFRTIIRPVAVAARWLLVFMHDTLRITYGLGLVLFGILVRLVLWPLNQKAMRASMQMQAIQPLMKDLQERHKNDPQRLQQEMFKLYKEYKVNPFGGCWPMLLPMPVLFALFFVFQNTIELRGAAFLWLNDLSRPDPFYVIPVVMGLSMYLVSKIGQLGMEPNPQMKMMLYVMPIMMTVLFANFPSGLNLYYTVQNLASMPQQYMLAQERRKVVPPAVPARAAVKGARGKGRGVEGSKGRSSQ